MKLCTPILMLAALAVLSSSLLAQSISELQGKWSLKKTHDRWGEITQTVEFKQNTFAYKVQSKSGETLLQARGQVKLEKLGPLKVMRLESIEGGYGEDSYQPADDDRTVVYSVGWNSITVAVNFDKDRDGEKAEADTYTKVRNP